MPKMIYRSADPLADFAAQDQADYEAEQKCPVCSNCGKRIPPCESSLTGNTLPRWEDSYEQRTQMQVTDRAMLCAESGLLHNPHMRAEQRPLCI